MVPSNAFVNAAKKLAAVTVLAVAAVQPCAGFAGPDPADGAGGLQGDAGVGTWQKGINAVGGYSFTNDYVKLGIGWCRGFGVSGTVSDCENAPRVNGRYHDGVATETQCQKFCNGLPTCVGYAYAISQTNTYAGRCFLYGPEIQKAPTGWESYPQPHVHIGCFSYFNGVVCMERQKRENPTSSPTATPVTAVTRKPTKQGCDPRIPILPKYKYDTCPSLCHCDKEIALDVGDIFGYGTITDDKGGLLVNCAHFGETDLPLIYKLSQDKCTTDCGCGGFYLAKAFLSYPPSICFKRNCTCSGSEVDNCHIKQVPTQAPTFVPTGSPTTRFPTRTPTRVPTTGKPTRVPTKVPTRVPTKSPTHVPTTRTPTGTPTLAPITQSPTRRPTNDPCLKTNGQNIEYTSVVCKCQANCKLIFGTIQVAKSIFVIDLSGSMAARYTNLDGQKVTRLSDMKAELSKQLGGLVEQQQFMLITFSTGVQQGGWFYATPTNLYAARNNISKWTAGGSTDTLGAMRAAHNQLKSDPLAHGVFLLSDGIPDLMGTLNTGEEANQQQAILKLAKAWGTPVSTIAWLKGGLETKTQRIDAANFMRQLATNKKEGFRLYSTGTNAVELAARQQRAWKIDACKLNCDGLFGTIQAPRITFVIDLSGSMSQLYGRGGGKTRLGFVQEEMLHQFSTDVAEQGLGQSQYFNIVTFSSHVQVWPQTGMLQATDANKAVAQMRIKAWAAGGSTNTEFALERALETVGTNLAILLSDGIPTNSVGIALSSTPKRILSEIRSKDFNPELVPVQTIAFLGGGRESQTSKTKALNFLMQLSDKTSSTCMDCTCDPCLACGLCPVKDPSAIGGGSR